MKFGPVPVDDALGTIAAHSVRLKDRVLRKGTVVGDAEIEALRNAGVIDIVVAKLEPGDIGENESAAELARTIAGKGVIAEAAHTGRCNLHAETSGVLLVDREGVDGLNRVDETITLATLPAFKPVRTGEMIGTIKIIPFAVAGDIQRRALAVAKPFVEIAPYRVKKIALISTRLAGLAEKVIDKTVRIMEARLLPSGASIASERRVPHTTETVAEEIKNAIRNKAELIVIFGASAIADRRDVIPAGIVAAGGQIEHFGMPVDPGNLMLIGSVEGIPVIGAPGCARSSKENGFDWLLARMLAGQQVKRDDVTGLGVGGLLMEIVTRPQPREATVEPERRLRCAAIVLAAGRSTRMANENKLLAEVNGKSVLVRTVEAILSSKARPVIVVTGHENSRIETVLKHLDVRVVHNANFALGISSSLKAGIAALPVEIDAAAIVLGDMPKISGDLIDRLAGAIDPTQGLLIAVPVHGGKRGNPVVWSRRLFEELAKLEGDVGARHLLATHDEAVVEIPTDSDTVFFDVDTQEALALFRGEGNGQKGA